MMTPQGAHKTLRGLLLIFAILISIGVLVAIFATGWLMNTFLPRGGGEFSNFLVVAFKSFGALGFFFAFLLYITSRDPLRYVAVIDALSITLFILAAIDIYSIVALHLGLYYPAAMLWGRVAVRILLGVALIVLRPRGAASAQSLSSR